MLNSYSIFIWVWLGVISKNQLFSSKSTLCDKKLKQKICKKQSKTTNVFNLLLNNPRKAANRVSRWENNIGNHFPGQTKRQGKNKTEKDEYRSWFVIHKICRYLYPISRSPHWNIAFPVREKRVLGKCWTIKTHHILQPEGFPPRLAHAQNECKYQTNIDGTSSLEMDDYFYVFFMLFNLQIHTSQSIAWFLRVMEYMQERALLGEFYRTRITFSALPLPWLHNLSSLKRWATFRKHSSSSHNDLMNWCWIFPRSVFRGKTSIKKGRAAPAGRILLCLFASFFQIRWGIP